MAVYGQGFIDLQPRLTDQAIGGFQTGLLAKMGPVGAAAGAALVVGIGAAIAAGVAALKIGETFDDAFDTIRIGTGATGDVLEGLKDDFKDVFKEIPTDAGTAAQAIADLNTRLGLTGQPLQDLSKQFIELSRLTGTDLGTNIETVTRTFGDWGIAVEDQAGALDLLFRASQSTGVGVDRLGQNLVKYGAPLRQLGFGFDEAATLVGKFEKEGVNTELVLGSLRIALGKMAREGENAPETFRRVVESIENAGSASEANALALELFGARAGPDMAAAIREGRFNIDELYSTIAGGEETILGAAEDTNDWRQSLEILKNRVLVALEPVATRVFSALGNAIEAITPFVERVIDAFTGAKDGVSGFGSTFAGLAEPVRSALDAIRTIADAFSKFWDTWGSTIIALVKNAIETVVGILSGLLNILAGIIDFVVGIFTGDWERAWNGIKRIFEGIWNVVLSIFRGVLGQVRAILGERFDDIVAFMRSIPQRILQALGNLGNLLFEVGKDIMGGLIRGITAGFRAVGDTVKRIGSSITSTFKKVLGIGSPSKVTAELGEFVAEGLLVGMRAGLDEIEKSAESLARAAIPPIDDVVVDFSGPVADISDVTKTAAAQVRSVPDIATTTSGRGGFVVEGDVIVHNPIGEPTEESLASPALAAAVAAFARS
jgi:TP901 family phage tail tape measure protein